MAYKILNGLDLSAQRIINLADPSASTDAVTKQYVDGLLQGLTWKNAVRAATTANITLSAPQTIDGVSVIAGDRVLVKNQTTASANGIYLVAAGAWTRTTDADSATELVNATVYVSEGTTQADTAWTQTANAPITLNSTSLTFAQVGGGGSTYTAGNGLSLSAGAFSVLADPAAGAGIAVTGAGVKLDTAVAVRKYAAAIGNGALTTVPVTHNLGTQDITWSLRDATSNAFVQTDGVATDANTLTLTFAVAPTTGQYRVVVHG